MLTFTRMLRLGAGRTITGIRWLLDRSSACTSLMAIYDSLLRRTKGLTLGLMI